MKKIVHSHRPDQEVWGKPLQAGDILTKGDVFDSWETDIWEEVPEQFIGMKIETVVRMKGLLAKYKATFVRFPILPLRSRFALIRKETQEAIQEMTKI